MSALRRPQVATFVFRARVTHKGSCSQIVTDECYGLGAAMAEVDAIMYLESTYEGALVEILSVTPFIHPVE